jgi:CheY-like chemotaxis protein
MRKQVLVIDPNLAFATMLQEALEHQLGYACTLAVDGREALQTCTRKHFDLAILDAAISDMSVSDVIAGLRVRTPALAVMLIPLYGNELPSDLARLDTQGVLPKPFFLPDLEQLVESALAQPIGLGGILPRTPRNTGLTTSSRRYTIDGNGSATNNAKPSTKPKTKTKSLRQTPVPAPVASGNSRPDTIIGKTPKPRNAPQVAANGSQQPAAAAGLAVLSKPDTSELVTPSKPTSAPQPVASSKPASAPQPVAVGVAQPQPIATPAAQPLSWLSDVNKAAQALMRLTMSGNTQAALLTKGEVLHAYAGHFSQNQAQEVLEWVTARWEAELQSPNDALNNPTPMAVLTLANGDDFIVCASKAADFVLSVVFPSETPLKSARAQARQLASALSQIADLTPAPAPVQTPIVLPAPPGSSQPTEEVALPPTSDNRLDAHNRYIPSSSALSDPKATPQNIDQPSAKKNTSVASLKITATETLVESVTAAASSNLARSAHIETNSAMTSTNPQTEETPQSTISPAGMYALSYAFVCVPKFPNCLLQGDLADSLRRWIPALATAYDWRLEKLDIRPYYLNLIITCSVADAPDIIIHRVMSKTSEYILRDFPRLGEKHPAGSFWSPLYSCQTPGRNLHPKEIQDFILTVRRQQGLPHHPV